MSRLQKNTAEVGLELWGSRTLAGLIVTYFHVFPQTGLPVGFYLRKKIDWTRWWARWAWLGADLALLGWAGLGVGFGRAGVWPCWARWLGWACWPCWPAGWVGRGVGRAGRAVGVGFGRAGAGCWACWACWARWLGWAWCWAWGLAVLGALGWGGRGVWRCWARWLGWAWCSK